MRSWIWARIGVSVFGVSLPRMGMLLPGMGLLLPGMLLGLLACGGPGEDGVAAGESGARFSNARSAWIKARDRDAKPSEHADAEVEPGGCPRNTEPARLDIEAIETEMTWCVKPLPGGLTVMHGPWEKRREGRLVELGNYGDDLRDGEWTFHWNSGERQSNGAFRKGEKAGVWTFWTEKGEVIRAVDYGDPFAEEKDEALGAQEPGEASETSEATSTPNSLRVANFHDTERILTLEPFDEQYAMPPGSTFEVSSVGEVAGEFSIESSDETITVWAWGMDDIEVWEEPAGL